MSTTNASEWINQTSASDLSPLMTSALDDIGLQVFKGIAMTIVIIATIAGNVLVIASIAKFRSLRSMNNYFIVSLAVADLLVGLMVQPFNMYNEMVQGEWKFGHAMCNFYNSNDVFFTTVSLLHLCCISCDRYIAILHPFLYERAITRCRVMLMIASSWILSGLLSYGMIFGGWYTTKSHLARLKNDPTLCTFEVSKVYAFISSSISFWIPCTVMVILYQRILKTALRQEREILAMMKQVSQLQNYESETLFTADNENNYETSNNSEGNEQETETEKLTENNNIAMNREFKQMKKLRKEHRAAKTLGIIMGSFILCMGPIFLWYTITFGMCPLTCKLQPQHSWVITLVFWIGYFNSCMNPFIYAFFNRDFQTAFKRIFAVFTHRSKPLTRKNSTSSDAPVTPPIPKTCQS